MGKAKLKKYIKKIVDVIYPLRCPVCDEILEPSEGYVHEKCQRGLRMLEGAVCMHCGRPLVTERAEYCFDCDRKSRKGERFWFEQGRALLVYQGMAKNSMYRFKYSNKREYAEFYAELAMDLVWNWIKAKQVEVILPVPMFRKKQRRRGYNQAEVFAKALASRCGIPVDSNYITRVKDTTPMKELNDIERKNNLKNAFQISKFIVKYNKILVVDDIYTTGSTAEEVSRILKEAGVEKIYFLSVCMGEGI